MKEDVCYYEGCSEIAEIKGLCLKHYNLWLGNVDGKGNRGRSLKERFWSFVWMPKKDGCWLWRGSVSSGGYGMLQVATKTSRRAHRVSWELHFGMIQGDVCVLHTCDNPLCVNPKHLWLGSHADNMNDMSERGRSFSRGESNNNSKLTEDDVLEIRRLLKISHLVQRDIAKKFEVTATLVSSIKYYKNWNYPKILGLEKELAL